MHRLGEGIWEVEGELRMPLGVCFGLRMTVLMDGAGKLVLHSPVKMSDEVTDAVAGAGDVSRILAPNAFHHLYAGAASRRFAEAELFVASGVQRKNEKLASGTVIEPGDTVKLGDGVVAFGFEGSPKLNEVVVFHEPSKTLVLTDLVFNVQSPKGWLTPLVLCLVGAHKRLAQSRLVRMVTSDRDAAQRSAEQLMSFPFERIVMSHGEVVEDRAKDRLAAAMWWMLGRDKPGSDQIALLTQGS